MQKLPISVVINTYNEEKNIRNCLESVKWAKDIVIVDMYSTDNTVKIAREYTDRIYSFKYMRYADPARAYAVSKAKFNWVLIVDADELVPYKMFLRVKEIIENDIADVVYFPHNNYFFGVLLRGNNWGPLQDMHPRLFKKGFVKLTDRVHDMFEIHEDARLYFVKNPEEGFIHFNYIDAEHFLDKLNRYTTIEAENIFDGKKKPFGLARDIYMILREVGGRFFFRKGYRDGILGFYLALLMGCYRVSTALKYYLMKKYNSKYPRRTIIKSYNDLSKKILDEYKRAKHHD